MFIITTNLPDPPSPTASECSTLIAYANDLIAALGNVQTHLLEASDQPDASMVLLREKVASMLSTARTMRSNLYAIQSDAKNNVVVY